MTKIKRQFGSVFARMGWGNSITETEHYLLSTLVERLPESFRAVVENQFNAYDLMQREIDGRALNFYMRRTANVVTGRFPFLPEGKSQVFPLIAGAFETAGSGKTLHAKLHVVERRVFSLNFSQPAKQMKREEIGTVTITESWRSNISA